MSIRVPTHSVGRGRSTRVLPAAYRKEQQVLHQSARNNAWKAGAVASAVTGKLLKQFTPPSMQTRAHAYSRYLINNGWRPYQQ